MPRNATQKLAKILELKRDPTRALELVEEVEARIEKFELKITSLIDKIHLIPGPAGPKGDKGDKPMAGVDFPIPRDGRDGVSVKGEPGSVGKDGQNGSPDAPEEIAGKLNSLEQAIEKNVIIGLTDEIEKLRTEIQSKPSQMRGMRKIPIIKRYRLTDQVDGITKAFTLPQHTVDILGVWSSQFPITFDSADWTFSGRTLTLADSVGVPQSGQTLMVIIETLFYG